MKPAMKSPMKSPMNPDMKRRTFLGVVALTVVGALGSAFVVLRRRSRADATVTRDRATLIALLRTRAPYAAIPDRERDAFAESYLRTDGWRFRELERATEERRDVIARIVVTDALLACGFFAPGGPERLRFVDRSHARCRNPWVRS